LFLSCIIFYIFLFIGSPRYGAAMHGSYDVNMHKGVEVFVIVFNIVSSSSMHFMGV